MQQKRGERNEAVMSSMFCGITRTSKLLSDMRKMHERYRGAD